MTRREFVGAAPALAAFTIVPRHVLGGPGRKPPSDKLNIAGIGVSEAPAPARGAPEEDAGNRNGQYRA
jgi:hypothetical protein